jgi:c-di-GMP-binding flagellar brake protein YcgR
MHVVQMEQSSSLATGERRQWPRIKAQVQAELQVLGNSFPIRVKTADLSMGGCYVEMMFTLEIGTELHMVFWLGSSKLSTRGRVVTRHPQFGNGIQFENMMPDEEARLETYLRHAEREIPQ